MEPQILCKLGYVLAASEARSSSALRKSNQSVFSVHIIDSTTLVNHFSSLCPPPFLSPIVVSLFYHCR